MCQLLYLLWDRAVLEYLRLIVHSNIPQVYFKISGAFHHHPTTQLILCHLFFKSVLGDSRVVKIIGDSNITNMIATVL